MKLLLIAPSTRAMAESAVRAGYNFVSLDFFGDSDQRNICINYSLKHDFREEFSVENLFRNRKRLEYTHVIYGSGFENRPEYVEAFEKESILLGNSSKTLRRVRNWEYFFNILEKLGISHPKSIVVSKEEVEDYLKGNSKVIIKPLKSGGGHSIYDSSTFKQKEELESLEDKVLLQEFISGTPASATFLVSDDMYFFLGATEQLIGTNSRKYRYTGNIAPLSIEGNILEKIKGLCKEIAREFRLKGSNTVDFILRKGEPFVIEVNPRITGAMEVLEKAYGVNLLKLHVEACINELSEVESSPPKRFYGKRILFADKRVIFKINRMPFVKDVPWYGEKIDEGGPICTVIGSGKTREECLRDLKAKEAIIRRGLFYG